MRKQVRGTKSPTGSLRHFLLLAAVLAAACFCIAPVASVPSIDPIQEYYLGEDVAITGTNSAGGLLYFYIQGLNYDFTSIGSPVETNADGTWSQTLTGSVFTTPHGTPQKSFDAGTYTVYVSNISEATSLVALESHYEDVVLELRQPYVTINSWLYNDDGTYMATGFAPATDSLRYYIFGTNYFTQGTTTVSDREFTITGTMTHPDNGGSVDDGQYGIIIQHPMYDREFNLDIGTDYPYAVSMTPSGTSESTILFNVADRLEINAYHAVCNAIDDQRIDDLYDSQSFIVGETPISVINPIPSEIFKGEKLTVSGQTNLAMGTTVTVKMLSTAFAAVPEDIVDSSFFISLTNTTNTDGSWEVTFDTAGLNVDEYIITAIVGTFDAVSVHTNVISGVSVPEIIVTPSGTLMTGQEVTGLLRIELPAGSITDTDTFSFSSPLENAQWEINVYRNDQQDPAVTLTGSSTPEFPFTPSMFSFHYGDAESVSLTVSFTGVVQESLAGSAINVMRVTGSPILPAVSPTQIVYTNEPPVASPTFFDLLITPHGSLEAGQTVTGVLGINLPAGSISDTDTIVFSSPLINAKWDIHVIGGYPGPNAVISGTSTPKAAFKPSMFSIDYDMQDITLLVRFSGKVPETLAGSSVSVINIQCSSANIGSYVSFPQVVYDTVDTSTELAQLKYDLLRMEDRLNEYAGLGVDVSAAQVDIEAANAASEQVTKANNHLAAAVEDLSREGLKAVSAKLDTIDASSAFLKSLSWDAEADYLKEQADSLRTLYDSLAKGTVEDIAELDELVYTSSTVLGFAELLPSGAPSDLIIQYIGEDVTISGTSADTKLYAYIAGTNKEFTALNKDSTSSNEIAVTNGNWKYTISGSVFSSGKYDAQRYVIYLSPVAGATSIDDLSTYTEAHIYLLQPFVSITDAKSVALKGTSYSITGTALATDSITYYIFGTNYFDHGKAAVTDNKFSIKHPITMAAGQYFVVIQHPMYDKIFETSVSGNKIYSQGELLFDLDVRQAPNVAWGLCEYLDSQNFDDTYTKYSFIVAQPSLTINPIPSEITKGTLLTVSGQTNMGDGVAVTVKLSSTTATAKTDKDGYWEVSLDTSYVAVGEYDIMVSASGVPGSMSAKIKVVAPQESGIIITKLPSNNVVDLATFKNNMPKLMVSVKGESGTLPKKDVTWTSSNPDVLSVDDDGRYTPHKVGKATITATTEKGTASEIITVIDTKPKEAKAPIKEPTKVGDQTQIEIESAGQTNVEVSADKSTTAVRIETDDEDTAIQALTVIFEGEVTPIGDTVTGKVQKVTAEYKPASAAPAEGVGGTVDYQLSLALTNTTIALPKINAAINSDVAAKVIEEYPDLKLAAMITAETNADDVNLHLAKTGDGITLTFIVPKAWVDSMEKIVSFHVKNGVIIGMEEISHADIKDLQNGFCKITLKRGSFSTHGLAGEEKGQQPQQPTDTSSPTPQGSSVWLTEPLTPTPSEQPTETPTDIPTTQPTQTETQSPGFGVLAVLAGLGAVAVLRRR